MNPYEFGRLVAVKTAQDKQAAGDEPIRPIYHSGAQQPPLNLPDSQPRPFTRQPSSFKPTQATAPDTAESNLAAEPLRRPTMTMMPQVNSAPPLPTDRQAASTVRRSLPMTPPATGINPDTHDYGAEIAKWHAEQLNGSSAPPVNLADDFPQIQPPPGRPGGRPR